MIFLIILLIYIVYKRSFLLEILQSIPEDRYKPFFSLMLLTSIILPGFLIIQLKLQNDMIIKKVVCCQLLIICIDILQDNYNLYPQYVKKYPKYIFHCFLAPVYLIDVVYNIKLNKLIKKQTKNRFFYDSEMTKSLNFNNTQINNFSVLLLSLISASILIYEYEIKLNLNDFFKYREYFIVQYLIVATISVFLGILYY
ncbi:hypothetical protein NUSPORA_00725 [Nucleospora cyclopteri]